MTSHDLKSLLLALYGAVVEKRWDAVRELLHPDFVDHSPELAPVPGRADGAREAFLDYFRAGGTPLDGARVDIERMLADEEMVMVHYRLVNAAHPGGLAVVDIFRCDGGRFVEHWDVLQPVPTQARNPRAMF